jgi:hypothetical protein
VLIVIAVLLLTAEMVVPKAAPEGPTPVNQMFLPLSPELNVPLGQVTERTNAMAVQPFAICRASLKAPNMEGLTLRVAPAGGPLLEATIAFTS